MWLRIWLPALALIGWTGATGVNADPRFTPHYSAVIAQAPSEPAPPRSVVAAASDAGQYTLDVEVEGPPGRTIQAGRPVRLRAKVSVTRSGAGAVTASSPFDDAPIAFEWQLASAPDGYVLADWVDSDGRSVVFADPSVRKFDFLISVSMWTGGPKPLLKTVPYTLTTTGPTAQPNDPPKPPIVDPPAPPSPPAPPVPVPPVPVPPVDPPVTPPPPQPSELSRAVRDAVIRLVPENCRGKAIPMAQSYAAAATPIEKLDSIDIVAELRARKAANDATLGTDRPMWDAFFIWLGGELKQQVSVNGQFAKGDEVARKWSQISLGLVLATGGSP